MPIHFVDVIAAKQLCQAINAIASDCPPELVCNGQSVDDAFPQAACQQRHAERGHSSNCPIGVKQGSQTSGQDMPGIPSEAFIATVSGESNGHIPPSKAREKERRNLRFVSERLIPYLGQFGNDSSGFFRSEKQLGVIRAEVLRYLRGMGCFVESALAESDGERANGPGGLRLHQRDDSRTVDTAGQEQPYWHVGDHALAHGLAK